MLRPIKLTKIESHLLLACKQWDLTEFLDTSINSALVEMDDIQSSFMPLKVMVMDYRQLAEYYHIHYYGAVSTDLYTVVTRDLYRLVQKLRPMYIEECVINSIDIVKARNIGHNYLFQLLRNQLSTQVNISEYVLCTEQLPTKYLNKQQLKNM